MNQAAKITTDSLLGLDFQNVEIGGVMYTIKSPTIKTICRAISHFSTVDMAGNNIVDAIKNIPEISNGLLKGLSCFICGTEDMAEVLANGTFDEAKNALEVCFSMMDVSAFLCASSMKNVSMLAASPKQ